MASIISSEGLFADLVLLNGKVVTVDSKNSIAQAVAVKGNRIVQVGRSVDIKKLVGSTTRVMDLKGRTVLPGFTDGHVHFLSSGLRALREFKIPSTSVKDVLRVIKEKAATTPEGEWLIGGDIRFAHVKFAENRWPTRWELDAVAPNHLVFLHLGPHIKVVNSKVLKLAKITKDTPDPVGGTIVKDPNSGEPTGVLRETASHSVRKLWPQYTYEDRLKAIKLEGMKCLKRGVTSVHEIVVNGEEMKSYQDLYLQGELPLRVRILIRIVESSIDLDTLLQLGLESNFGNEWLKIGGTKMSVGGGISGSNAALYEEYADEPGNYGVIRIPQPLLVDLISKCNENRLQCHVHALGDKDLDLVIQAFEAAAMDTSIKELRHRVEHAGCWLFTPERRRKFRELGLIAVPNINFLYSFGDGVIVTLGPKRIEKDIFPLKSMLKEGMLLVSGTDGPGLEPCDALRDIGTAILRKTEKGVELDPTEAITVMDGIRMFTINQAYIAFEEKIKGSIEPNKLADLVVLAEDPLTTQPEQLKDIQVDVTILDGKVAYERENA
ncbi:MAG: amidohydrolase [Candidatus Bathyarchaeota archaeon]|nr:amidohydrolase [Candidatus Bathyarchaeota archaeon]